MTATGYGSTYSNLNSECKRPWTCIRAAYIFIINNFCQQAVMCRFVLARVPILNYQIMANKPFERLFLLALRPVCGFETSYFIFHFYCFIAFWRPRKLCGRFINRFSEFVKFFLRFLVLYFEEQRSEVEYVKVLQWALACIQKLMMKQLCLEFSLICSRNYFKRHFSWSVTTNRYNCWEDRKSVV